MDKKKPIRYQGKYILEHITSLESCNSDFDFGLLYLSSSDLKELKYLEKLENKIKLPYIIITDKEINTNNFKSNLPINIIEKSDCNKVDSIILQYFKKENNKGSSKFKLYEIINSVERIQNDIIIQIKSEEKLAIIIVEKGKIVKIKTNEGDSTIEKLLTWKNNLIKLKKMNNTNLDKIKWFLNK